MTTPVVPAVVIEAHPQDRLSGYAVAWSVWVLAFAVIEGVALYRDSKNDDRVKRTLSANIRYVTAYDSVNGLPLNVKHGKLRRLAFSTASGWFETHIKIPGSM